MDERRPGSEIVVGLDDSPSARTALSWAADYARAAGLGLRAVHVFSEPKAAMGWARGVPGMAYLVEPPNTEDATARMGVIFREVHPDPGWVLEIERGPIGPLLVERSRQAAALVLGTRDHVGIDRLVVGSVSHHCLSHASCPVVAVPAAPVEDATLTRPTAKVPWRPPPSRRDERRLHRPASRRLTSFDDNRRGALWRGAAGAI